MNHKIKPQIIQELIEVIQKYDCTYNEASELLSTAIRVLKNQKINFETSLSTKREHVCSKCGGKMTWDKITVIMTLPAQYPYYCEKCGHKEVFKYNIEMFTYTPHIGNFEGSTYCWTLKDSCANCQKYDLCDYEHKHKKNIASSGEIFGYGKLSSSDLFIYYAES